MKRHLGILLTVLLVVAAIGPLTVTAQDDVTLTLMTNWGEQDPKGPILAAIIEEFEAEHPGVSIDIEIVPDGTQIPTEVETAFLAGKEPDIVLHNFNGTAMFWMQDGLTVPLTDYANEWGIYDNLKPEPVEFYTRDGELAAIPLEGYYWPMWVNTQILEEAGIDDLPATWEEFVASAGPIRDAGYQPFVVGGTDWTGGRWFQMYLQNALTREEIYDLYQNGGWSDNEKLVQTVEAFVEARDAGLFADDTAGLEFASMNEMFFSGQAAYMHGGSWSFAELPDDMVSHVTVMGMPVIDSISPYDKGIWWSAFAAKGFHVTRNGAKHIEEVGQFAQYLYQPENIARFVEASGMVSPLIETPFDPEKLHPLFVESSKLDVVTLPSPPEANIPAEIDAGAGWFSVTSQAFVEGTSAEDILNALDELYESLDF